MKLRSLLPLAVALVAASCRDEPPKIPSIHEALPNMPLPPDPTFVSKAGSENALQFVFSTPVSPERALAYYRGVFAKAPWHLVSDQPVADSGRALYAERDGPPIWVMLTPSPHNGGTIVSISGAVVTKPAPGVADTGKPGTSPDTGRRKEAAPR